VDPGAWSSVYFTGVAAYDTANALGATKEAAVSTALAVARASNERVTEEDVREWLARALVRRRLAVHNRSKLKVLQDAPPIEPAFAWTRAEYLAWSWTCAKLRNGPGNRCQLLFG
jgi:hypothetical protein